MTPVYFIKATAKSILNLKLYCSGEKFYFIPNYQYPEQFTGSPSQELVPIHAT